MRLSNYTLTPTRINNAKAKARLYVDADRKLTSKAG